MSSEHATLSLSQVVGIIRRRGLWILLCFVVTTGVAFGYSKHKTKTYTATAALTFSADSLNQQIAGLPAGNSTLLSQIQIDLELVKLGNMAASTATILGHGLTQEKVAESVSVQAQGETGIVTVAAASTSPQLAAAIANTYARQFILEQQQQQRAFFVSALALVRKQLKELSPEQRFGSDGLELQTREQTLTLLKGLGYDNVSLAGEAPVPTSPSSPKVRTNTVLGAVVGLLIGIAVALLLERFDRRLRDPEDLGRIYGLPTLGLVPRSAALVPAGRKGGKTRQSGATDEVFALIRAHLRFFDVESKVCTLLIASPSAGDGKTTVARCLAEAAVRFGSRVLLLEADLRRPTLAAALGVSPGPGLAGALIGAASFNQAVRSVAIVSGSAAESQAHELDVVLAGEVLPPNPGELLESTAMVDFLFQARSQYDLVVIDTAPMTAVSDDLPLLREVDGVVVVGRVGFSDLGSHRRFSETLVRSNARLLGVVPNDVKSAAPSTYPADRNVSGEMRQTVNG